VASCDSKIVPVRRELVAAIVAQEHPGLDLAVHPVHVERADSQFAAIEPILNLPLYRMGERRCMLKN